MNDPTFRSARPMASGYASAENEARAGLPARVISELRQILGADAVLDRYEDLLVYEYDAYQDRSLPQVVVRPASGEEVAAIVRLASRERLAITPRGGASGPSGGGGPPPSGGHPAPPPEAPAPPRGPGQPTAPG